MNQYNSLNIKLPNSQLNKLISVIKNKTELYLRLSSNMIRNSNNEINFPHKLLLINRHVANLQLLQNNSLTDIERSKTEL